MIKTKTLIILLVYINLPIAILAQYEGGSGRQEALFTTSLLQLNDGQAAIASQLVVLRQPPSTMELSQQFSIKLEYRTANGQLAYFETGNVSLTFQTNPSGATLGGTATLAATDGVVEFSGLSVDKTGTGYALLASGAASTSAISNPFTLFSVGIGGSGRQEALGEISPVSTLSGEIFWVGGIGSTPTDWNDRLNWRPDAAVPGSSARIAIEPNNNGHNPILDQNRTVYSINFNSSDKLVELGGYDLSIEHEITGADENNYFRTNGTGALELLDVEDQEEVTFPVGNSAYNPLAINNKMGTSDAFSVRVADNVWLNGYNGPLAINPRVTRTWYITNTQGNANAGSGVDFRFAWNEGETDEQIDELVQHTLFHYNDQSQQWEYGQEITGTTQPYGNDRTLSHTGYKGSFSPFAIGTPLYPLPVTWMYFTAEAISENPRVAQLDWATATEINSSHFEVEWSTDGFSWTFLGTVEAAGNSYETITYRFVHDNAAVVNLYRLKQVDLDGQYSYSSIRTVSFHNTVLPEVRVYPNPSIGRFTLSTDYVGSATYDLLDISGRLIRQETWTDQIEIAAEPGIYLLRVFIAGSYIQRKVVVL